MSTNNANYQFEKSLHDNLIIDLASDGEEIIFECQPQRVSRNNEGIFLSSSLCTKCGLAGEITTRLRPVLISLLSAQQVCAHHTIKEEKNYLINGIRKEQGENADRI